MGYIEPITRRLVGEVTQWDGNRGLAVSGDREFVFERRHIGSIPYVFKVGLRVEIFVDYDETGAQHSFTLNPVPQYGETWFEFCGEEILLSAEQARRLRSRFAAIALRWGLAAAASGLLWLGANSDWSVVSAVILQMATIAAFMRCMDIFWKSRQIYAENSVLAGITEQVLVVSAAAVDWPSKNRFCRLVHQEGERHDGSAREALFAWDGIRTLRTEEKGGKEILYLDVLPESVYFSHHAGASLGRQGWEECLIPLRLDAFDGQDRQRFLTLLAEKNGLQVGG
ncbi:hypothetical protein [Neisseria sp. CCUG12390]|uniref:hypothetical protein n=1 Tax=Neisseria sp. CCUG12390 TaxID=3392035 RepID=UPI003A1028F0